MACILYALNMYYERLNKGFKHVLKCNTFSNVSLIKLK